MATTKPHTPAWIQRTQMTLSSCVVCESSVLRLVVCLLSLQHGKLENRRVRGRMHCHAGRSKGQSIWKQSSSGLLCCIPPPPRRWDVTWFSAKDAGAYTEASKGSPSAPGQKAARARQMLQTCLIFVGEAAVWHVWQTKCDNCRSKAATKSSSTSGMTRHVMKGLRVESL